MFATAKYLALLLVAEMAGCQSTSDTANQSDGGERYSVPAEGAPWDGPVPAGYPVWPPPYFFHFVGFENAYSIGSVYADEQYIYWGEKGDYINRIDKVSPGDNQVFMHGPICYGNSLFFDGPWLYCLGLSAAMRIDRQRS